jgi:SAM-dependent methyltransferase
MGTRTSQYVDGTYSLKVADWHAEDSPRKAAHVLRMLARHRLVPKTICDVGCGAGEVLVEMQRRMPANTVLTGCDISPQAIAICRPKENRRLKFIRAPRRDMDMDRSELLLLLDVFEHVPDYVGLLEALRAKASWFVFHIPLEISLQSTRKDSATIREMRSRYGHLHHFTKGTALATLADAGYDVVDHFYTDDWHCSPPRRLRHRVSYEARRLMFRLAPNLATLVFHGFNLLVLARPRTS